MKRKKQKIREGAIIKIDISDNRVVFARQFSLDIGVYDFVSKNENLHSLEEIITKDIFCYCAIYDSIITSGIFEIIGNIPLTEAEIEKIPPKFHQELGNYKDCRIFWADGRERKVWPEECVGLERSSVWGMDSLKERIQDYFSGKRNFDVEISRVILYEDDPRYVARENGLKLKWDFEKRVFYVP
ncbi:MAG: Imm26 family immunity protein [Bacteroidota bacterium]